MEDDFGIHGFAFASSTQQSRDAALLRATTDLFVQELVHDRDEIRRFGELAQHLLPKVPLRDRAYVAERLALRLDAPEGAIRFLARDEIAAAAPILRGSPVLTSLDLLSIIAVTAVEHHRLIAARPGLSDEVVQALRMTRNQSVAALVKPPEAAAPRAAPSVRLPADDPAEPALRRPPGLPPEYAPGTRPDAWTFLALDRVTRIRYLADLALEAPGRRPPGQPGTIDRAFRSILSAAQIVGLARSSKQRELVEAIGSGLGLEPDFVRATLHDPSGEALAVLLRALGLDNVQAQQVFLLAAPLVGRSVSAFFKICDLYACLEPAVAETLAGAWRDRARPGAARHEPHFAENSERRRAGTGETPARPHPATVRISRSTGA